MENNENGFDSMFEDALKALDKLVESSKMKPKEQIEAARMQEEQRKREAKEAEYARKKDGFDDMAKILSLAYDSFRDNGFSDEQSFTLLMGMVHASAVGGKK